MPSTDILQHWKKYHNQIIYNRRKSVRGVATAGARRLPESARMTRGLATMAHVKLNHVTFISLSCFSLTN
jgi:hypothetical protein